MTMTEGSLTFCAQSHEQFLSCIVYRLYKLGFVFFLRCATETERETQTKIEALLGICLSFCKPIYFYLRVVNLVIISILQSIVCAASSIVYLSYNHDRQAEWHWC